MVAPDELCEQTQGDAKYQRPRDQHLTPAPVSEQRLIGRELRPLRPGTMGHDRDRDAGKPEEGEQHQSAPCRVQQRFAEGT